jgi:hypothetical protein
MLVLETSADDQLPKKAISMTGSSHWFLKLGADCLRQNRLEIYQYPESNRFDSSP